MVIVLAGACSKQIIRFPVKVEKKKLKTIKQRCVLRWFLPLQQL